MTGPDRLRPNEVAGTGDVDAINAIMREALGDDWASILIPQRSDPPGPGRWIRLADMAINPDTLDGIVGAGYATALRDVAYQAARNLDGRLRDLPEGWSWCEHAFEWLTTDPGPLLDDRFAFTARVKGHRLAPGETCPGEGRRTVYGPMTPEIRRAAGP